MLPGKTYAPEDYLQVAWRRRWLIAVPTILVGLATFVWVYTLPNVYRSETSILIVPARVPRDYVRPTVTAQIDERLQMISQQILSRSRLERIMQEFNLYTEERRTLIMEDVIEKMRRDIGVEIVGARRRRQEDASAFAVSYQSSEARTAMLVTERLASLFMQENLQDRELLADATNQFLQAQLEDARRRLIEHEKKLEAFRSRNAGRLPSQVQSNLQMMQTAQARLQALVESADKDRDRLAVLDSTLRSDEMGTPAPSAIGGVDAIAVPGTAAQQLELARLELRRLELRLKPAHPDIARMKRTIAELEAKADAEALQQPLSPDAAPAATMAEHPTPAQTRAMSLRMEAEEIRRRLATRKQEEAQLKATSASFTARLEAAPALESELTELMRDYSTLQNGYTELLRKSEESKIAVNLERRQIGEQFKIIDSARLPERPVSPNRIRLNSMGILAGFGLGIALIALLEYRDTTLKTDDDVVLSLAIPVIAVIPVMTTASERRRHQRRQVLAISASVAAVVLVAAAAVWKLGLIDQWVR